MITEQGLINLIKKDCPSKDFYKACELKLTKLKNEPQKKLLIKIIRLFYSNGSLELGIHLSHHKGKRQGRNHDSNNTLHIFQD